MKRIVLASLSLIGLSISAHAAVVYTGGIERIYDTPNQDLDVFDIDGDGDADVTVQLRFNGITVTSSSESAVRLSRSAGPFEPLQPAPPLGEACSGVFSKGTEIGAILGEAGWVSGSTILNNTFCLNNLGEDTSYVGIELRGALEGEVHYGWLAFREDESQGFYAGGVLEGWAYESIPDRRIITGAIPEPGTGYMIVFATVGFWMRRSRDHFIGQIINPIIGEWLSLIRAR